MTGSVTIHQRAAVGAAAVGVLLLGVYVERDMARVDVVRPPTSLALGAGDRAPAGAGPSLDKEVIRDGIRTIIPDIQRCFEAELETSPALAGRLVLRFTILARDGKGVVDAGEIQPDSTAALLGHPRLGQCVLAALAAVEFPAPGEGSVEVSYPIVLRSVDEPEQ